MSSNEICETNKGFSTKQKRTTTTATVSSQLNYKLIQLRKNLQKMQKFVVAVLKKLLNGYSVIPVYYGCTLHVLSKNKCNAMVGNYICQFSNTEHDTK